MNILQIMPPSSTDYVQAFAAVVSLIIAICVLVQGKRIKELADIVDQLKEQNIILNKRYQIEKDIALMQLMPFFKYDHPDRHEGRIVLHLHNVGLDASDIQAKDIKSDHYTIEISRTIVASGQYFQIDLKFADGNIENVDFNISAKSPLNKEVKQRVYKTIGNDIEVDGPTDII